MGRSNLQIIIVVAVIVVIAEGYFLLQNPGTPETSPDSTPPTANAGNNLEVEVNQEFLLDAGGSTDDTGIVSYEWDLDGISKSGETVTHSFSTIGEYPVTLTVSDEAGNTDQATITITVNEPPSEEPITPDKPEEPATIPVINGIIGTDEYPHSVRDSTTGITVHWYNDDEVIYFGLVSPGTGWVAIGIDPVQSMRGANFIFGYVQGGEAMISDQYGVANFAHSPDISQGGTEDVLDYAVVENQGTVFEFKILLDTGDPYDKPLEPGGTYPCIISYHSFSDSLTNKHTRKAMITITLD